MTNIPVVSILPSQFNKLFKDKVSNLEGCESILARLPEIYKNVCKRGLQTFLSPTSDLTVIPQRTSDSAIYARCIQIYKSAFSTSTLKLLESGELQYNY